MIFRTSKNLNYHIYNSLILIVMTKFWVMQTCIEGRSFTLILKLLWKFI